MSHEVEKATLARYLEERGLKHTRQRDAILEVFLSTSGHTTSEEIYQRVKAEYPKIGHTTVYRTMKILVEAGLAQERHFDESGVRYEVEHEHHDHLVCIRCGKIIEFDCQLIEKTQEEVADRYRFRVLRHRHELYGHCEQCQREG